MNSIAELSFLHPQPSAVQSDGQTMRYTLGSLSKPVNKPTSNSTKKSQEPHEVKTTGKEEEKKR
jgi:hypothetical protein